MAPEISIIVPVYNVEKYIDRCIDSILRQTFADFELILVDDGSLDQSGTICDEYAQKDERIRIIHKENGGVSDARNAGIQVAQGNYFMFCDSDDYVDREWCERMFRAILEHPSDFLVSNVIRVDQNGVPRGAIANTCNTGTRLSYYELFRMGLSGFTFNKIYNREVLIKHNILFDPSITIGEDVVFNVKYFAYCSAITYIDMPLYFYRDNSVSALNRYHPNWLELNLVPFYARIPLIEKDNLGEYCDRWLYIFIHSLDTVFDKRNCATFIQKLRYNQRMMGTEEFRYCLANATGKNENQLVMKILRTHSYYLYWLFQKIVQIKNIILH